MKVCKIFEWCYSHKLDLPYPSKCENDHGHNAKVEVKIEGPINERTGMVIDFAILKQEVEKCSFDHKNLNKVVTFFQDKNPTAENMVIYLMIKLKEYWLNEEGPKIYRSIKIRVWETSTSYAEETFSLIR